MQTYRVAKSIRPARKSLVYRGGQHIPFDIKRVFYLYDVPTGNDRGAHAHKTLHQFLICLSGSFDVTLDDGVDQNIVHLNQPWKGLHIPPMVWAAEVQFVWCWLRTFLMKQIIIVTMINLLPLCTWQNRRRELC